ncbi:MAG: NfeD family protein [Bryobacterales bacterium]|jgi:inner membrane protein|nr:NfeD family protein [Bryobacterales bacterium]
MDWWIWLVVGLLLLLSEAVTPGGFYLFFLGMSAIAVGALSGLGLGGPLWFQWLLFSVLSALCVFLLRQPLQRALLNRKPPVDSMVGDLALAVQEIAAMGSGKVEYRGTAWNARNLTGTTISAQQQCRVESVDGLTLLVRPE